MQPARLCLAELDRCAFLTDGGMETSLIFHQGVELPLFASFPLLFSPAGRRELRRYILPYLETAAERGLGFVLDTPTWRANPDWAAKLGYSAQNLIAINRAAVAWAEELRREYGGDDSRILIEGAIGPRGDGYRVERRMSARQAQDYHALQVEALCDAGADMIAAFTMNYPEEAIGVARAARAAGIAAAISFTVETDGRLASGDALGAAIEQVEEATDGSPAYYMINCAHPTHFADALAEGGAWTARIRGLRANASARSHAELDASADLDAGDPADLGRRYAALRRFLPRLRVFGGCCGTDHRHILSICDACLPDRVRP